MMKGNLRKSFAAMPMDKVMLDYLESRAEATAGSETASAGVSWVPLATGAEPAALVSNGAGSLIFVAWRP